MSLWPTITWSLLALAAALGAWAILSDPAKGRLRCPGGWRRALFIIPWRQGCWYDMAGVAAPDCPAGRCPECGREWRRLRELKRRRIRWRMLPACGLVLLGSYAASVMPRVRAHGWWAGMPTWGLVLFAPVDETAREALTWPLAPATIPAATQEMLTFKWERPFWPWESAILGWRLKRAVDRQRGAFPGQFAVFVPAGELGSERFWGWDRPFTQMERVIFSSSVVMAAQQMVWRGTEVGVRASRRGPMIVLGGPEQYVRDWLNVVNSVDRATRRGYVIQRIELGGGVPPLEVVAYDVSDISPARLVPATRAGQRANMGSPIQYAIGDPVDEPNLARLGRAVWRIAPQSWQQAGPVVSLSGTLAKTRGTLLIRNTRENHERIIAVIDAIREVIATPGLARRGLDAGAAGLSARVIDLSWLKSSAAQAAVDADIPGRTRAGEQALNRAEVAIEEAMRAGNAASTATADRVAHVVLLVGTETELAAGEAAIERLRVEGPAPSPSDQTARTTTPAAS